MTAAWPVADARLERRYRRLLLAYPSRFRRTEMVTTLLEMAEPGQTRPRPADAWHLLTAGVRQRYRLPTGRPLALLAAVLTTLILGGFGAAAGSWAAERTFTDLPGDAAFTALVTQVAGAAPDDDGNRQRTPWTQTFLVASADHPGWNAESARQALSAGGWQVSPIQVVQFTEQPAFPGDPVRHTTLHRFDATRHGLRLSVNGHLTTGHGLVSLTEVPIVTGALLPLVTAGALAGLLAGWPLTASVAYRFRRRPPARARVAAVPAGLAPAALLLPALAFYGNILRIYQYRGEPWPDVTVHSALTPGPYYPFGPPWLNLGLTVAGAALTLAALAVLLPRPTPATEPDGIPATG